MPYSRSENELVSAVMTGRLLTAHASDQLAEAARRMADRRGGGGPPAPGGGGGGGEGGAGGLPPCPDRGRRQAGGDRLDPRPAAAAKRDAGRGVGPPAG